MKPKSQNFRLAMASVIALAALLVLVSPALAKSYSKMGGYKKNTIIQKAIVVVSKSLNGVVFQKGYGFVYSRPKGISCGSYCSATFTTGTLLRLYAVPASTTVFSHWTGCTKASSTVCSLHITESSSSTPSYIFLNAWFNKK